MFAPVEVKVSSMLPASCAAKRVPVPALAAVWEQLRAAVQSFGGRAAGWDAFEIARIEVGIPRYGADMDETHLPPECGIENRAVSYQKGCYIGQEVLNRLQFLCV